MINIFNELFSNLTDELKASFPDIKTSSAYTNMPSSYPFVSLEEINNSIYESGIDDGNIENFVSLDYELNIYAVQPNKKAKAEKILKVIDSYFTNLGFIRNTTQPIPTGDDTVHRIVVRYSGVSSKNKTIYRR